MTLIIKTISHGDLDESGFVSGFMDLVRFGDYCFSTKNMCETLQLIAENPKIKKLNVTGYNVGLYYERFDTWVKEEVGKAGLKTAGTNKVSSELLCKEPNKETGGTLSIPFVIKQDGSAIKVGKYEITADNFTYFSWHVVQGGLMGWESNQVPLHASEAQKAMLTSKHDLFKSLRNSRQS